MINPIVNNVAVAISKSLWGREAYDSEVLDAAAAAIEALLASKTAGGLEIADVLAAADISTKVAV